ncbi:hypothetical protein [Streptomyces sp. JJ36]|uniref:hypothetical protein n=1 Tax=Streptomyces sp. JJ36 TaxID=2736645 RepID=UPI001F383CFA|nr:hypothetical protein [Streptomyces sp. JJ36]MCF6526541.1 hypothetical protein [Streptomyces sp. JJ36]
MSVDPTDPDLTENQYDGYDADEPEEEQIEAPEADAAEQHAELLQQRDLPMTERRPHEVDPADAAEQARVVELDEDDYR